MCVRLSVWLYACPSGLGGNVIFSAPNWDITPIFFTDPLINKHLFCKYFVRWSADLATKGRNVFYLFLYYHSIFSLLFFFKRFATYGCCHPCLMDRSFLMFSNKMCFNFFASPPMNVVVLVIKSKYSFLVNYFINYIDCF